MGLKDKLNYNKGTGDVRNDIKIQRAFATSANQLKLRDSVWDKCEDDVKLKAALWVKE